MEKDMNITNEKLYEMIVNMRTEFKAEIAEFKAEVTSEITEFKAEVTSEIAEVKAAQSELRADITKWGVALFIGSIVAMTSIIGVFLASVVLAVAS